MRKIKGCLLLVALWLASPDLAQSSDPPRIQTDSAQTLSLEQALQIALENHPALRRAEAAVRAAEAEIKQVRSRYFPQLSFSSIGKVGLSGATSALALPGFPASPFFRNLAFSVNWYQNVFDFGRTKHRLASAKGLAESAGLGAKAEGHRIAFAVKRAYFSVLEANRLHEVAEETVKERNLTLERVQAYYQAQLRSRLDVTLARANLAEAEANLVQARSAVHIAFAALRAAMGTEQAVLYQLEEPQDTFLPLADPESLVQTSLVNRPDLQALESKIKALSEEVGVAYSSRLPEVRGFAASGQGRFNGTPVKKKQRHGLGALGIFFPFFTGGRLKAEEKKAQAELEAALALRDELRQQVRLEVTRAYYQILGLRERIRMATEQEVAAQEALRLARARFGVQLASFLELRTAEVALTRAETSRARSLYDYQRARAALEFATGQPVEP